MNRIIPAALLAAAAAAMMVPAGAEGGQSSGGQVVVSAAVSLTETLQQLAPMFHTKGSDRIVLNLGASNTLARQISFGAGADLFISADEAQMNAVAAYIDPASRVDLLANQLAVAVPDDRARMLTSIR